MFCCDGLPLEYYLLIVILILNIETTNIISSYDEDDHYASYYDKIDDAEYVNSVDDYYVGYYGYLEQWM